MMMTDEQLSALEAAAKAATPGPWVLNGLSVDADGFDICGCTDWRSPINRNGTANAAYIAAANPAAVLDLIAELRKARMYMTERHVFRDAWKEELIIQHMLSGWLESIAKGETPACMVECKTAHDFVSYAAWVDAKRKGLPCSETFGKSNGE